MCNKKVIMRINKNKNKDKFLILQVQALKKKNKPHFFIIKSGNGEKSWVKMSLSNSN